MNKITILFISTCFSLATHFVLLYNLEISNKKQDFSKEKSSKPNNIKVAFSQIKQIIPPKKELKQEKKIKPKPKKKLIKKKLIKKKLYKKIIKKPKPKLKSKPIVKQNPKIIKPIKRISNIPKNIVTTNTNNAKTNEKLKAKQNIFLTMIKEKIDKNKIYPTIAKRRKIETNVKVRFTILDNGKVNNIMIISGKRIFYKATIRSIKNSFPIKIPIEIKKSFPMNLNLQIRYKLTYN